MARPDDDGTLPLTGEALAEWQASINVTRPIPPERYSAELRHLYMELARLRIEFEAAFDRLAVKYKREAD
jgi:hypothetical protein